MKHEVVLTIDGPGGGRIVRYRDRADVVIGSAAGCDVRFSAARELSPRHVRFEINPPACRVVDLNSSAGTWLHGHNVAAADLKNGDVVECGGVTVQFQVVRLPPATGTPMAERPHAMSVAQSVRSVGELPVEAIHPRTATGSASDHSPTVTMWPERLRQYELIGELGRGSMGVVYLATNRGTTERVAIKVIGTDRPVSENDLQLFLREASILGKLVHPRIVPFREIGIDSGRLYLVMSCVSHRPFEAWVEKHPTKRIRLACGAVSQALDALGYAHLRGVVHRDIKPENLLLSSDRGRLSVRVVDFGLAKNFQDAGHSGLTAEGEIRGSLAFMAPEQVRSTRTARPPADIYSAGATLYAYLSGKLPYEFPQNQSPLACVLGSEPVPLSMRCPELPPGLLDVVGKAMSRSASDRFRSAAEFKAALHPFLKKD